MIVTSKHYIEQADCISAETLGPKLLLELITAELVKNILDFMKEHDMGSAELIKEFPGSFKEGNMVDIKLEVKIRNGAENDGTH